MSFLKKLLSLGGCARLSNNKEDKVDDKYELPELVSDTENIDEKNGLPLPVCPEESLRDQLNDMNYTARGLRSPSLGRRIVDRVRASPRLARKAMSKMTSPLVSRRRKKDDEIFIDTLPEGHSSGIVWRAEEWRSDAW